MEKLARGITALRLILCIVRFIVSVSDYKTWMCLVCGLIYDEAVGWPDDGIVAGTRWHDVPISWSCPECGARKEDFEMVEI